MCFVISLAVGPTTTGINKANDLRGVGAIHTVVGQKVHTKCREKFCNPKYIELAQITQGKDVNSTDTRPSISISF